MRSWVLLIGWILPLSLLAACSTTDGRDGKDRPRVGVIGHGTTPGYSWAGVGVTVPLPGKQANPPTSEQDAAESGKSKTER